MRMPYAKFLQLADMLSESIKKQDTPMRMAISPRERLALTLRFLASGESFQSRIGKATVGEIIIEVCEAIYHALKTEYLQTPNETAKWKEIADLFHSRWNIPNNLGAIDGKRIVIQKPAHAGSHFHDYKVMKGS